MEEQVELKEPKKQETSSKILNLLICGYTRDMPKDISERIPDPIYRLCQLFYPRSQYLSILNQQNVQLTLCDVSRNDTKLSSNKVISLNKNTSDESGGNMRCGICYKDAFAYKNGNYNAIFKYGGQIEDRASWGVHNCDLILYPNDITNKDFNTYTHRLPSLPYDNMMAQYNAPVYSDIYGLIILGFDGKNAKMATFDVMNQLDNDVSESEMKWDINQLPNDIFSVENIVYAPSYCLINNNQKDLFIINGSAGREKVNKNTVIYDLETKDYRIIAKKNKYATSQASLLYCDKTNRVYVGGGQGDVIRKSRVYFYDLLKGKYVYNRQNTSDPYPHPLLWTNDSGTILNIAGVYVNTCHVRKINHEWIDLREPANGWKQSNNMNQLGSKIWEANQYKYLVCVNIN